MASHVEEEAAEQGSPFFPRSTPATSAPTPTPTSLKDRVAAVGGLAPDQLKNADTVEMQHVLEALLGALKNVSDAQLQSGERAVDGSLRIASHLAVWLIGKVTDAYGAKLVRLSRVPNRESLRSISGLAELLIAAISKKQGAGTP